MKKGIFQSAHSGQSISGPDAQKLLHELEVHQIELTMQNDELRHAKEKAEYLATQYADLYNSSPTGYFTLAPDGTISELNYSGAGMLGKVPSDLAGSNFRLFISQDTLPVFNDFLKMAFDSHSKQTSEISLKINENPPIYVFVEGIVSSDKQKCLLAVTDITQHKQNELFLKESEKRLQELNTTKDKFFSIIAHDLKNPFNSILGFSNLLAEQIHDKDFSQIDEFAGYIQSSSQLAMDLLGNLLEWTRSQTGRMVYNPEFVEMVSLIKEVASIMEVSARQKKISIVFQLPRNAPVNADKAMISTILRNLISNAVKFTQADGEIVISAGQLDNELLVSVSDNGVGIKKESLNKLFRIEESFTTSGTNNELGTGLGLILCKEFVDKHHGKIWVESKVGKGSKFCFTIPK